MLRVPHAFADLGLSSCFECFTGGGGAAAPANGAAPAGLAGAGVANGGGGLSVQAQRILAALSPKLPPGKPIPTQTLNTVQVRTRRRMPLLVPR